MKKNRLVFLIFIGLLFVFILGTYFISSRNKSQTNSSAGYKSYILKMNNPNPIDAMATIKESLLSEFESCKCLSSGYPKIEKTGIKLSEKECDFIGVPGFLGNTTFGVDIYLLPNNIFSKVNSDTPSIFIGDITPGRFCQDSPFFGLNKNRREVIEKAFSKVNVKGYEKYD